MGRGYENEDELLSRNICYTEDGFMIQEKGGNENVGTSKES